MKKEILTFPALILAALAWSVPANAEEHAHEHGETCTHDHARHHDEEAEHTHDDHDEVHEHDHAHAHDEHAQCDGIDAGVPVTISDKVRKACAMQIETVGDAQTAELRSYYGQMSVPADAEKTAALPVAGRVKFAVKVGEKIARGQTLYTLFSPALIDLENNLAEAEANLRSAQAEIALLEERLARLEKIGTKNSELEIALGVRKSQLPALESATARARGLLKIATDGADYRDGALRVPASCDGVVQSLDLSEGAWGEQGASALTYVAQNALEFKTSVFGNDDFDGVSATLVLDDGDQKQRLAGKLRIGVRSDDTLSRPIYFEPENLPASAFVGQLARLDIASKKAGSDGFVLVPNSAVIKSGTDNLVFVCDAHDANRFFARKVETLPSRRGMTPVHGVFPGEKIVVKGGYELKYALPSDAGTKKKAAGHFHADGKFHEGEH